MEGESEELGVEVKHRREEAETSLSRVTDTSLIVLNNHFIYLQGIGPIAC